MEDVTFGQVPQLVHPSVAMALPDGASADAASAVALDAPLGPVGLPAVTALDAPLAPVGLPAVTALDTPLGPAGLPGVTALDTPLGPAGLLAVTALQLGLKRATDIVGSLVLLIGLAPVFLLVALLVRVTSPGPIFYPQERLGVGGQPFRLWKFRSMYRDAEQRRAEVAALNEVDGPVFKIRQDPRVTPVGRVLRKLSIDELPQLFNVLLGHMSLVGPRPPLRSEYDQYTPHQRLRLLVKPGLTCIWQVSGRSDVDFDTWVEMDLSYIRDWSIWLDLKLLLLTLPAVLSGRGAY